MQKNLLENWKNKEFGRQNEKEQNWMKEMLKEKLNKKEQLKQ